MARSNLNEGSNPLTKKTILIIVLGLVTILIFWFFYGFRNSRLINSESLVTVGQVTSVSPSKIYFRFSYQGNTYNSAYTFKRHSHSSKNLNDRIYIRFHPDNPNVHIVLFKDSVLQIVHQYGAIVDSINTQSYSWWDFD